jgi:hypothetical protein
MAVWTKKKKSLNLVAAKDSRHKSFCSYTADIKTKNKTAEMNGSMHSLNLICS